jgi:hypothetical protein
LCYNLAAYIISRMKEEQSARAQKHKKLMPYALMACVLTLSGCAQQQKFEPIEKVHVPDINKAEAFAVVENVLADMHFTIEKADYESGIIRTKPLSGAQFFELWRNDNVGAFNTAEANLHSIRRTVELQINKYGSGFSLDCVVQTQRLEFTVPYRVGYYQNPGQLTQTHGATWKNLGKDTRLATEILKRIISKLDARRLLSRIEN